jgi:hypothetical protein
MYKFVQGRVDASHKWGEHVEELIFDELGLCPIALIPLSTLASSKVYHLRKSD